MPNAKQILDAVKRSTTKKERNSLLKQYPLLNSIGKEELLAICLSLLDAQFVEDSIDQQEEKPVVLNSFVYGLPDPTDPESYLEQIPEINPIKAYRGGIVLSNGETIRPSGRGRPNAEILTIEELAKIHAVTLEDLQDEKDFANALFEGKIWIKKEQNTSHDEVEEDIFQ